MNQTWVFSVISLAYCIFHLTALTLSLVFWKRHPKVCGLVLAGSILNLLALGARQLLPTVFFPIFGEMFALFHLGISFVSLSGASLYLLAIFTGRRPDAPRGGRLWPDEDDDWDRPASRPSKSERGSTGIRDYEQLD
jgi:hypothetical protein